MLKQVHMSPKSSCVKESEGLTFRIVKPYMTPDPPAKDFY